MMNGDWMRLSWKKKIKKNKRFITDATKIKVWGYMYICGILIYEKGFNIGNEMKSFYFMIHLLNVFEWQELNKI